jgi:hypothetical protein
MDKSAFQLFKNTNRTNTNAWLHSVPIIDFGRVIKVIDIQTVIVETIIQTSLSKEIYTVTLLNLSSNLLEISDEPQRGDTVLLLFLRKHHPLMFMSETVNDQNAAGYNKFSGIGILMSAAKKAAHTVISCYDDDGEPVTDITSDAEIHGTFNNLMTVEFCRAVFDSEDEQIIRLVFGAGRPLVEKHLARTEREHGFWKDPENELVKMDASVTETYSIYSPITKDIQGTQTKNVGLGKDKEGNPVETDAPVSETIHGKAPITKDIRSPQNITIGIGNDETEDPSEQREAPLTIEMGEDADIELNSGSAANLIFEKSFALESKDIITARSDGALLMESKDSATMRVNGTGKLTLENQADNLGKVLSDFIQAVHDAITLGSPTTQAMNPATKTAMQLLKTRCEAVLDKGA